MSLLMVFVIVSFGTALMTAYVRRLTLSRNMIDMPNKRSSHHVPTPRGGGLAIVGLVLVTWLIALAIGKMSADDIMPMFLAGAMIAGVGYLDDRGHVPVLIRLSVHIAAALVIAFAYPRIEALTYPGGIVEIGISGAVLTIVYIVWLTNLYNFMDGIDGLACVEAVTVTGAATMLFLYQGNNDLAFLAAAICASAVGFLFWNWAPAKIFMGDVGSGFLGFCLAALSIISHTSNAVNIYVWWILLGSFIVDATTTLLLRIVRRQRFYEAHRSHAYQHAALKFASHAKVTLAIATINICWLLPIAFLVASGRIHGIHGILVAYTPLIVLALVLGAGKSGE